MLSRSPLVRTRPGAAVLVTAALIAVVAFASLILAGPAVADDTCPPDNQWLCEEKTIPPKDGSTGGNSSGTSGGSGSAPSTCSWAGKDMPCSLPGRGFFYQGCYYTAASPAPDDPIWQSTGRSPTDGTGGFYNPTFCMTGEEGVMGNLQWLPIPRAATMTPEELARRALAKIKLLPPSMHLTPGPGKTGLVSLPVWLWTDANANTWGPIQHTDSDGPLSVTLTAKVNRIVWSMGDGGSVTCTLPGIPYSPAYNDQPSPQCGYAYQHSSKGQPGDAFTVTATTYWDATWTASTGETGSFPGVTRTATVGDIRVGELQVVNG